MSERVAEWTLHPIVERELAEAQGWWVLFAGVILGAALLIWPALWIPRLRWRAWRDRRRLEKAQWKM